MSYGKIRFPRTIIDGKLQFLSVSQVEKYADPVYGCPRQWAYDKIEGIKADSDFARDLGVETHDLIDHYTRTGEDVLNHVARAGKHLLYDPPPDGLEIEHESLGDIEIAGVPFYVRLDLWNRRDYWLDDDGEHRPQVAGTTEVLDYKTTGDISKKPRAGRALLDTVQMPVYGLWALAKGSGDVRLSHAYFGTRKREARKVSYLASRDELEGRGEEVSRIVERMKNDAGALRAAELEPNFNACHASYRGCPYLGICPRTAAESLEGMGLLSTSKEDTTMGLMDLLKKPAPAQAAEASPKSAPVEHSKEEIDAAIAKLEAERAAKAQGTPPLNGDAARAKVPDLPPGAGLAGTGELGKGPFVGVVPPDAPAPGTTAPIAKEIPPETLLTMPPPIKAAHAKVFPEKTGNVPAPPPVEAPSTETAAPAVEKTKGRKPKTPPAAASETDGGVIIMATGITLFVDVPVVEGAEARSLEPYVQERLAELAAFDPKASHYLAASNESPLAFGKWKGILALFVKRAPPAPGVYRLDVEGSEAKALIATELRPLCALYVRGGAR